MRFSLLDLLIGMMAVPLGTLAVEGAGHMFGFAIVTSRPIGIALGIVAGATIYLVTTPLIYQRLRMRPLWYPFVRHVGTRIAFGNSKQLSRSGREKRSGALLAAPCSNSGTVQNRMIQNRDSGPPHSFSSGHSRLAGGGESI
jgi:hypothetical protein